MSNHKDDFSVLFEPTVDDAAANNPMAQFIQRFLTASGASPKTIIRTVDRLKLYAPVVELVPAEKDRNEDDNNGDAVLSSLYEKKVVHVCTEKLRSHDLVLSHLANVDICLFGEHALQSLTLEHCKNLTLWVLCPISHQLIVSHGSGVILHIQHVASTAESTRTAISRTKITDTSSTSSSASAASVTANNTRILSCGVYASESVTFELARYVGIQLQCQCSIDIYVTHVDLCSAQQNHRVHHNMFMHPVGEYLAYADVRSKLFVYTREQAIQLVNSRQQASPSPPPE